MDRVKDRLQENGYRAHAVLTISEITETLYQAGRINEEQFRALASSDWCFDEEQAMLLTIKFERNRMTPYLRV